MILVLRLMNSNPFIVEPVRAQNPDDGVYNRTHEQSVAAAQVQATLGSPMHIGVLLSVVDNRRHWFRWVLFHLPGPSIFFQTSCRDRLIFSQYEDWNSQVGEANMREQCDSDQERPVSGRERPVGYSVSFK